MLTKRAGAPQSPGACGAEGLREALRGLCDPRYAASRRWTSENYGKANFAITEFSEVRVAPVRRFVPLCGVPGAQDRGRGPLEGVGKAPSVSILKAWTADPESRTRKNPHERER